MDVRSKDGAARIIPPHLHFQHCQARPTLGSPRYLHLELDTDTLIMEGAVTDHSALGSGQGSGSGVLRRMRRVNEYESLDISAQSQSHIPSSTHVELLSAAVVHQAGSVDNHSDADPLPHRLGGLHPGPVRGSAGLPDSPGRPVTPARFQVLAFALTKADVAKYKTQLPSSTELQLLNTPSGRAHLFDLALRLKYRPPENDTHHIARIKFFSVPWGGISFYRAT